MWLSTFTGSSEPLSRLLLGTFKEAKLILMHPEIDRTTEHISYNLTQQLFPSCGLGTAGKLLWFTSGMATCRVSTVSRLVFSVRSFFASWDPLLLLRDPTQVSQQLGVFPELWLRYFLRELAAKLFATSHSINTLSFRIWILRNPWCFSHSHHFWGYAGKCLTIIFLERESHL